MVARPLCMRQVPGSIPGISIFVLIPTGMQCPGFNGMTYYLFKSMVVFGRRTFFTWSCVDLYETKIWFLSDNKMWSPLTTRPWRPLASTITIIVGIVKPSMHARLSCHWPPVTRGVLLECVEKNSYSSLNTGLLKVAFLAVA